MPNSTIPVTFHPSNTLPSDVTDAGLRNSGTLDLTPDGITVSAKRPIPFISPFLGIIAGGVGIGLVIAGVIGLQMVGFDLLAIRRGTTLAAVVSLVVGIGSFGLVLDVSSRLIGIRVHTHVPWQDVVVSQTIHAAQLSWEGKGATCIIPTEHREVFQQAMPNAV